MRALLIALALVGCAAVAPVPASAPVRADAPSEFCTGFWRNGLTSYTCLPLQRQEK